MFAIIRAISRQPVPDILKVIGYRRDFFGAVMQKVTHEAICTRSRSVRGRREVPSRARLPLTRQQQHLLSPLRRNHLATSGVW